MDFFFLLAQFVPKLLDVCIFRDKWSIQMCNFYMCNDVFVGLKLNIRRYMKYVIFVRNVAIE